MSARQSVRSLVWVALALHAAAAGMTMSTALLDDEPMSKCLQEPQLAAGLLRLLRMAPATEHDAHASRLLGAAHRHLAKLEQAVACSEFYPLPLPGTRNAQGPAEYGSYNITVYAKGDVVSDHFKDGHGWDDNEVKQLLWALEAPLPANAPESAKVTAPVLLDIGANLGGMTLPIAAKGYEVLAFEGSRDNRQMLRQSICANGNAFMSRITLYPFGLGSERSTCYMLAEPSNLGNCVAVCGVQSEQEALAKAGGADKHVITGVMQLHTLDSVLHRQIKVLKMDVEGHEAGVLKGAMNLLRTPNVWFIMLEVNMMRLNQNTPKGGNPLQFVHDLAALGYDISIQGFKGPFISAKELDDHCRGGCLKPVFFVRTRGW